MNLYYHLIENPLFFKWIYHPTEEINLYWEKFMELNPEDAELILDFKSKFEKHLQYKTDGLSELEKKILAREILQRIELENKKKNRFRLIRLGMRYAAVAIIFLIIGTGISYLLMVKKQANDFVQNLPVAPSFNIQEPTLIIENQPEIALKQGESELEYSAQGKIKIDNDLVIENDNENSSKLNTLVIPYGNRSTITLADGTKVWLNAGSRLIYPSRFVDKKREIFLVGEAFFQVEKDKNRPFIVKTPDIEVKVLGTKFNLSAYPEDNIVQTVLTEGSVEIKYAHPGIFDRSIQLKPGQLASVNKQKQSTNIYNVDVNYYTSWTEGFFSFSNTDLSRVVKRLERYFNIRFIYDDPLNGSIKISGKLDVSKNKEEVFEYMTKLTELNFSKINERTYIIK
ncbi:FecR domain-containing protein [Prolixibacteraceae bacterium Z1-6]|uniref:FecR domain-containing protein n=1 Tax=Draconibacterium aestuarii TaxID=2998507 RepID=A0A9X3J8G8_9BACT|nr:FecR domain-containing protein [Prolixibacteraceae bacterium Z1-6]